MHIEISLATKFRLKLTLEFLDQINIKGYSLSKKKKITIEFYIFKLIFILNFSFNKFDFWYEIPKKYTSGRNQKKMNITIEFFIFKVV